MWNSYDAWKTACCGAWPNCNPCCMDGDYDPDEEENFEDERADWERDHRVDD